jgi:hypothetical protein
MKRTDCRVKQSEREKKHTYSVVLYDCLRVIQDSKKKKRQNCLSACTFEKYGV